MTKKTYDLTDIEPIRVSEPIVSYGKDESVSSADQWSPNQPFHGTQEEWWDHFHKIEEGKFHPAEETFQRLEKWLENYGKQ